MSLDMGETEYASQTALLFEKSGASVKLSGSKLNISGDLGKILDNCLSDSDSMYNNEGQVLTGKYGYNERQVLFNWWNACKEMDRGIDEIRSEEIRSSTFALTGNTTKLPVPVSGAVYVLTGGKIGEVALLSNLLPMVLASRTISCT